MQTDQSDLLHGMKAIGAYLGLSRRQAYHMRDREKLPTFDMAGRVCARRSTLDRWLSEREAAAMAGRAGEAGR